jgi:hypothetical protein
LVRQIVEAYESAKAKSAPVARSGPTR